MFDITFLPATIGDSIWISYGKRDDPSHILIDGGTRGTRKHISAKIKALKEAHQHIELMVVSHVDKDHIGGILAGLENDEFGVTIGEFWFNSFMHLPIPEDEVEHLGALQGEALTSQILRHGLNWNGSFGKSGENPIAIDANGDLPVIELPGGMKLTLLSPTLDALSKLRPKWEKEVRAAGLVPGEGVPVEPDPGDDEVLGGHEIPDIDELADVPFDSDDSEANASSISFLAEFEGKCVLFAADAHVPQLIAAIDKISPAESLKLDLFKVSHHGSKRTVSVELIERVDCPRFVFSSNGSIFHHPHREGVARVIKGSGGAPELLFNYKSDENEIWGLIESEHDYTTRYPEDGDGISVSL